MVDVQVVVPDGQQAPVTPDSPEGLALLRHSTAHLMAAAVQALFPGAKFAIGPAIEDGFYYDMELPRALTPEDLPVIDGKMRELAASNLAFERRDLPLEQALAWARDAAQTYKVEILEAIRDTGNSRGASRETSASSVGLPRAAQEDADMQELAAEAAPDTGAVSLYQTGSFVDLCRGPHVPDTSCLQVFRLTHIAGAYWRGDERRPMLQRIYGTAFATQEALDRHLRLLEEARRRDHRRLGVELDLFSVTDDVGGGLILWHPKGGIVRKLIEDFWRDEHLKNGYDLVYTPHVGRAKLWQTSGHLDFYQEMMYPRMEREGNEYFVRPMNCPFHIMIYQSRCGATGTCRCASPSWERSIASSGRGFSTASSACVDSPRTTPTSSAPRIRWERRSRGRFASASSSCGPSASAITSCISPPGRRSTWGIRRPGMPPPRL